MTRRAGPSNTGLLWIGSRLIGAPVRIEFDAADNLDVYRMDSFAIDPSGNVFYDPLFGVLSTGWKAARIAVNRSDGNPYAVVNSSLSPY